MLCITGDPSLRSIFRRIARDPAVEERQEVGMAKLPLRILVLAAYMAITGIAGFVVAGTLLIKAASLKYANGFAIAGVVFLCIIVVPAVLSVLAAWRIWVHHARSSQLIRWTLGIRIMLSLFPPGFVGPLGVGFLAVPIDLAVFLYTWTRKTRGYFVSSTAGGS
jgi:hypothetical protein